MFDLNFIDKVVIITGAGGSLGKAYALEFAKRGAYVVENFKKIAFLVLVNDLGTAEDGSLARSLSANATVAEIKFHGGKAVPNFDSVECGHKIIETAITHFGRVDIIVNNAGILLDRSFQNMSYNDWDLVYRTHVKGAYSVTKAAWPFSENNDMGDLFSYLQILQYTAILDRQIMQRNALIGLSHTLAIEGNRYGIHSNVVIPTASSRLTAQLFPEESLRALRAEYVVPIVIYLGHESCQETGKIFEAGAVQAYRSKGIVIPAASAEAIADNWITITDMTSAKHFDNIQEVTVDLLNCSEQIVAKALYERTNSNSTSCFTFMLILTNGIDVYSSVVPFGGDHIPGQRELICIVTMHCDLLEQILKGQIITKRTSCRLSNLNWYFCLEKWSDLAICIQFENSNLLNRPDDVLALILMKSVVEMETVHKKLLTEWNKEPKVLTEVNSALKQVKEMMENPEILKDLSSAALHTIHRDVYEIDALCAVLQSDLEAFREAISVVMNFYNCYRPNEESPNKFLMIGLNLMYFLTTNQHAQFHMLLEQIDQNIQQSNPYITTPVKLEQSLMEGVYNKVVLTEKTSPVRIMRFLFVYLWIQYDLKQLLQRSWKSSDNTYVFEQGLSGPVPKEQLDTKRIAKQTIFYAKQLEMIV
ncbi:Peroxisomal multifunctional enzyme A [Dirofilaria immitis]|nr:Peroxisomal multifunctional enzyme A [Dirofilaria immitis]